jgi:hypothetical protein
LHVRNPVQTSQGKEKIMMGPIEAAKAATPWWMMEILDYDGLELHPVRDHRWNDETMGKRPFSSQDDNETWCEPCVAGEEHFFSVYGHCKQGGVMCFEDFATYAEALAFAQQLLAAYPHLRTFGLMDFS